MHGCLNMLKHIFTYEFYIRYGEFPFGERAHGIEGIIQTYENFSMRWIYGKVLKILSLSQSQVPWTLLCLADQLKFRFAMANLL